MENLKLMSKNELIETNGGHDGLAYELGQATGKALLMAATVLYFFSPKS
jgi:hypothetical protein